MSIAANLRRWLAGLILVGFPAASVASALGQTDNPCPEGWFQDLTDDDRRCRELAFDPSVFSSRLLEELESIHIETDRVLHYSRRSVGFDRVRFDAETRPAAANVFPVASCDETTLRSSLGAAKSAGGGRVELPACTLLLSAELEIPSNTVLSGSDKRTTSLELAPRDDPPLGSVVRISDASNVIVRDLAIRRRVPTPGGDLGIAIVRSDNVLIEGVGLSAMRVAVWVQHSANFTVRYSEIRDLARAADDGKPIKALSFGECDQAAGSNATTASCESSAAFRKAAQSPTGTMWTAGFAFYSNEIVGVESWGSSSASVGEIAGNRYAFGRGQLKIDDGRFVMLHHNHITGIRDFVVFRVATEIRDRGTKWIGLFDNLFEENSNPGGYLLNFTTGEKVYLLNNRYVNNTGTITLRPRQAYSEEVYICPLSEEARPRSASSHEGASPEIRILEEYDLLCSQDGGRYLFRN